MSRNRHHAGAINTRARLAAFAIIASLGSSIASGAEPLGGVLSGGSALYASDQWLTWPSSVMDRGMGRSDLELEILRKIVSAIPVNVMHHFMRQKKPSEYPLHDEAMLHNIARFGCGGMLRRKDANIPVERHAAAFPPRGRTPWPSSGRMGRNAIGFQYALNDLAGQAECPSDRALARLIERPVGVANLGLYLRRNWHPVSSAVAWRSSSDHPSARPWRNSIPMKNVEHSVRVDPVPCGNKRRGGIGLLVVGADCAFRFWRCSHTANLSDFRSMDNCSA